MTTILLELSSLFQSTLPNGSDPGYMIIRCWGEVFQSTLPNGSDGYTDINDLGQKISIHAPKRERPHVWSIPTAMPLSFQSTLPNGSDGSYVF